MLVQVDKYVVTFIADLEKKLADLKRNKAGEGDSNAVRNYVSLLCLTV